MRRRSSAARDTLVCCERFTKSQIKVLIYTSSQWQESLQTSQAFSWHYQCFGLNMLLTIKVPYSISPPSYFALLKRIFCCRAIHSCLFSFPSWNLKMIEKWKGEGEGLCSWWELLSLRKAVKCRYVLENCNSFQTADRDHSRLHSFNILLARRWKGWRSHLLPF